MWVIFVKLAFNNSLLVELQLSLRLDHPKVGNKVLKLFLICVAILASHVALVAKNPPANAREVRDMGLTPG